MIFEKIYGNFKFMLQYYNYHKTTTTKATTTTIIPLKKENKLSKLKNSKKSRK